MELSRIEVVDDEIAAILRKKTSVERVALAINANRTLRLMLDTHFRTRHPEWTTAEVAAAVARRFLGGAA